MRFVTAFTTTACLDNGLCVSDPHNAELARFHRGTCTEEAWEFELCPKHCLTGKLNLGADVLSCNTSNASSFCCGTDCECNSSFETFSFADQKYSTITIIGEDFIRSSSIPPSSSTAAPTSTGVPTTSATSSPAANTEEVPKKKSNAVAIGAGVAMPLFVLALAGVAFFFWRRKKARRNGVPYAETGTRSHPAEVSDTSYSPPQEAQKYSYYSNGPLHAYVSTFADRDIELTELPASVPVPVELAAEPVLRKP
ncbi:hypothetical protein K504DRAFT_502427 [Pleomassaria siparia CBS 279.74]|uniref:Mid2 domain-containing protein n=1 Tax=Pleomassaria siparia CBS 279.74 TaxID=1314801 RepID=A0A6G1KAB2_9PLEO|nr:hypothetical protein K504DRAFT_502427 [Pleomassaria siparia CBS 279.74]